MHLLNIALPAENHLILAQRLGRSIVNGLHQLRRGLDQRYADKTPTPTKTMNQTARNPVDIAMGPRVTTPRNNARTRTQSSPGSRREVTVFPFPGAFVEWSMPKSSSHRHDKGLPAARRSTLGIFTRTPNPQPCHHTPIGIAAAPTYPERPRVASSRLGSGPGLRTMPWRAPPSFLDGRKLPSRRRC